MMATSEKKATAFHESGHVVVGYLTDRGMGKMSIVKNGDIRGETVFLADPAVMTDESLQDRDIVILLAGYAAQQCFEKSDNYDVCPTWDECFQQKRYLGSAHGDVKHSLALLAKRSMSEEDKFKHLHMMSKISVKLVNDCWLAIQAVADTILQSPTETLSAADARAVFDKSGVLVVGWPLK